jgi:probable HAF family extracellular repeat protein
MVSSELNHEDEELMKSRTLMLATVALLTALARPVQLAAQHTRYKLIDLGTFGGPASSFNSGGGMLNSQGFGVGASETPVPDPSNANGFPCGPGSFVYHAFEWQNGVVVDLRTLPGTANCSNANWINARGNIAGNSEIRKIDPVLGVKEIRAVLWKQGQIMDLGTLGGNESTAISVNNRDQVVGFALNTVPDPLSLFFGPTETRAFLWQNGVMQDLGTLGGPDALPFAINERGQVAGVSYTNSTVNPTTGMPTVDPFLWDHGRMIDIGTLGGTVGGPGAQGNVMINNRGQVIGTSNLAGDQVTHAFVWQNGVLTDLGTLGGDNSFPLWINDAGDIVGEADLLGSDVTHLHHAFLWKNGVMTDLGTLGSTSHAEGINSKSQVVGRSRIGAVDNPHQHAFLWENGGPMIDLNTLIPANSSLELRDALYINDRGEIAGAGVLPGCENVGDPGPPEPCGHAYLLIPVGQDDAEVTTAAAQNTLALVISSATTSTQARPTPNQTPAAWRGRLAQRYHILGLGTPKD